MAQKRAYVGAIILATGASDFFTQDIEDMDPTAIAQAKPAAQAPENPGDVVCGFGKYKDRHVRDIDPQELASYVEYIRKKAAQEDKPIRGLVKEFIEAAEAYLHHDHAA